MNQIKTKAFRIKTARAHFGENVSLEVEKIALGTGGKSADGLRTLTGNEIWNIMQETSGFDDLTKLVGTQIKTLSYSIISINDKKVVNTTILILFPIIHLLSPNKKAKPPYNQATWLCI